MEQTVSTFLPDVQLAQVLRALSLRYPPLEKELPKMISAGLQRLYRLRSDDGAWGYWGNDASDVYSTAYVVQALHEAQRAGFAVDPEVFDGAVQWLKNEEWKKAEKAKSSLSLWEQVFVQYVLSELGQANAKTVQRLFERRRALAPHAQAQLALALARLQDTARAQTVVNELLATAQRRSGLCFWQRNFEDYYYDTSIGTTAMCLRALLAVNPQHPAVGDILRYLMQSLRGRTWGSTHDDARTLAACLDYLRVTGEKPAPVTVRVYLNDKLLRTESFRAADALQPPVTLDVPTDALRAGTNTLRLETDGAGKVFYTALLQYHTEQPPPTANAFRVQRAFLRPIGEAGRPLAPNEVLRVGDELIVHVRLTAHSDAFMVVLEEPLPAGFSLLREPEVAVAEGEANERRVWWFDRMDVFATKVAFFFNRLPKGTHEFTYRLRAEIPGRYTVAPAHAYEMYHPAARGFGVAGQLQVAE
ncbi:MAG: hypothetical protein NZT92_20320 [Abditibacteriales bacterium]|nr:hypothetical protein [Abditibacteriales bacterium]MDW8368028.1 hypothetical protein [Abditibacteriales bacterium]